MSNPKHEPSAAAYGESGKAISRVVQQQTDLATSVGLTRDQMDLLKRTIAAGTSDDEFKLFIATANRLKLDPFARQIYAVVRPSFDPDTKQWERKMAIQVGIDGFRIVAGRTGQLDGQEGPYWCGDDGIWVDAWLHDAPPAAARLVVYRRGSARGFTGVATYRSYVQTKKDGKPVKQWSQMPDVMLAKCAEALALRKAFPGDLGGVYSPEEMAQADNPHPDAIDAEVVEVDIPEWRKRIDACQTDAELTGLVDELRALPDEPRKVLREHFNARRQRLRAQSGRADLKSVLTNAPPPAEPDDSQEET